MIQRGELPGDVKRLIISGRSGRDEAEAFSHDRQCGKQRERVEGSNRCGPLQCVYRHIQDREVIGHEERVELRLLESLREALEVGEVEIRVRAAAGKTPPGSMDADRTHESSVSELPRGGHNVSIANMPLAAPACRLTRPPRIASLDTWAIGICKCGSSSRRAARRSSGEHSDNLSKPEDQATTSGSNLRD